jgi:hypothetical protein
LRWQTVTEHPARPAIVTRTAITSDPEALTKVRGSGGQFALICDQHRHASTQVPRFRDETHAFLDDVLHTTDRKEVGSKVVEANVPSRRS